MLIRTTAKPRLIRKKLQLATEKLDATKLASTRTKALALVQRARAKAAQQRKQNVAIIIKRVEAKRDAVCERIKALFEARTLRTPNQVIQSFLRRVAAVRHSDAAEVAASLLIRSKRTDVASQLANLLGATDLKGAGITVRKVPAAGALNVFALRFPVSQRSVRNELRNLAWALRKSGAFHSVAVNGLRGILYAAPEPTAAMRAERAFAWHHQLTRTSIAHDLQPQGVNGRSLGEGVLIVHPDTGWAKHSQYNEAQIDKSNSHNVVTGDTGGDAAKHSTTHFDALPHRPSITHGTATGSLIVGGGDDERELSTTLTDDKLNVGAGAKTPRDARGHLTGVAPKAKVLPIKLISDTAIEDIPTQGLQGVSVVRIFDDHLIDAVQYAIAQKAHVISLSIGGLLHDAVREKLDEAIRDHDIIVVAAAGQTYSGNAVSAAAQAVALTGLVTDDSVVLPAAYQNVIAVAGCSPNGAPWNESHRGPNVDITAPADAIWVAEFDPFDVTKIGKTRNELLECAAGTSFATAIMAGVAALWRAHWGDDLARYRNADPPVPLAWVFRHQLQKTADAAHAYNWDTARYGPGVVNVEALLNENLPDPDDINEPPAMVTNLASAISDSLGVPWQAGEDTFLEFMDFLSSLADGAGKAVAAGVIAAQRAVEDGMNALAEAWAIAELQANELAGQAQQAAAEARDGIEKLIEDAAQAGEEFAAETAEQAENAWGAVEEGAEEFVDTAGEAAEDFVNWLSS